MTPSPVVDGANLRRRAYAADKNECPKRSSVPSALYTRRGGPSRSAARAPGEEHPVWRVKEDRVLEQSVPCGEDRALGRVGEVFEVRRGNGEVGRHLSGRRGASGSEGGGTSGVQGMKMRAQGCP